MSKENIEKGVYSIEDIFDKEYIGESNKTLELPSKTSEEILNLRLSTIKNSRQSLSRIIKMYAKKEIKPEFYRNLVYGICQLIGTFKVEAELSELKEIKEQLEEIKEGRRDYGSSND